MGAIECIDTVGHFTLDGIRMEGEGGRVASVKAGAHKRKFHGNISSGPNNSDSPPFQCTSIRLTYTFDVLFLFWGVELKITESTPFPTQIR